jgi:hypothetical protein
MRRRAMWLSVGIVASTLISTAAWAYDLSSAACNSPEAIEAMKFAMVCHQDNSTELLGVCRVLGVTTYRDFQKKRDEEIKAAAWTALQGGPPFTNKEVTDLFKRKFFDAIVESVLAERSMFANIAAFPVATGCAARISLVPAAQSKYMFFGTFYGAADSSSQRIIE